jgi:hypothetical protein
VLDLLDAGRESTNFALLEESPMSSPRKKTGRGRKQKSSTGWMRIVLITISTVVVLGLLCYGWKIGENYQPNSAGLFIFALVVLFFFFVHGAIFFRGLALLSSQASLGFQYLGEVCKAVAAWLDKLLRNLSS